jgi:hypothetical protein
MYGQPTFRGARKEARVSGDSRAWEGQPTDLKFAVIQINNLLVRC